jgi:membrane protein
MASVAEHHGVKSPLPSLWKFGGLTPLKLIKSSVKKIGEDELSTRSAALSYYFLLALFPMLLFLVSLIAVVAGPGSQMRDTVIATIGRLAPGSASTLIHSVIDQTFKSSSGIKLAAGILGALWAASGGMSAVVTSLNVIYRTPETRPWWKQKATIIGLTLTLAALIIVALVLVLYGGKIGEFVAAQVGMGNVFAVVWKVLQWPVSFAAMFLSFSMVYYFGPDVKERRWFWVTPGSAVGVTLWLIASVGFRVYLHFFNRYSATYGSLGALVILLVWLYLTGFAILVGGEVNSVIENEDKKAAELAVKKQEIQMQLKAA